LLLQLNTIGKLIALKNHNILIVEYKKLLTKYKNKYVYDGYSLIIEVFRKISYYDI